MARRTYRYFDGEPLYPFGYGLSYTTFAYSDPRVDHPAIPADGAVTISTTVANRGKTAGDEVVELYLTHSRIAAAPLRALSGFERIHLNAGESKIVSFKLTGRALSVVDNEGKRQIAPGTVRVWIGGGQPVAREGLAKPPGVQIEFTITSQATLPD